MNQQQQPQARVYVPGQPMPQSLPIPPNGGTAQSKPKGATKPMKSAQVKEPPLAILLKPVEWTARSVGWLTSLSPGGGARYVFLALGAACFLLSAETVYVAMPPSESAIEAGIENRKFLPKPAINDDAKLALLNPLPAIANTLNFTYRLTLGNLPFAPKFDYSAKWIVWVDSSWYLGVLIGLAIQGIEAIAWRRLRMRWEDKMAKFNELNSRKLPNLNPEAVLAAKLAHTELQAEGTGGYAATALTILMVYGVEFYTFTRSVAGASVPGLTIVIYGLVNIFGFELCLAFAGSNDDDKKGKG